MRPGLFFYKGVPVSFPGKGFEGTSHMPRRIMSGTAGLTFHVINRGVRKLRLFDHAGDYRAWLRAFAEAQERVPVDVFAYCLMPNHFHLVVRPREDGHLAEFMRLGTVTHSMRWHQYRASGGTGAVYQGRYKAFPVQSNHYFYNVCRYVEANAFRGSLVPRAEDWPWGSLSVRCNKCKGLVLCEWPILQPLDWLELVNQHTPGEELDRIRRSIRKNIPLGDPDWSLASASSLGMLKGFRERGRPRKKETGTLL
jgi:putative transposase